MWPAWCVACPQMLLRAAALERGELANGSTAALPASDAKGSIVDIEWGQDVNG